MKKSLGRIWRTVLLTSWIMIILSMSAHAASYTYLPQKVKMGGTTSVFTYGTSKVVDRSELFEYKLTRNSAGRITKITWAELLGTTATITYTGAGRIKKITTVTIYPDGTVYSRQVQTFKYKNGNISQIKTTYSSEYGGDTTTYKLSGYDKYGNPTIMTQGNGNSTEKTQYKYTYNKSKKVPTKRTASSSSGKLTTKYSQFTKVNAADALLIKLVIWPNRGFEY